MCILSGWVNIPAGPEHHLIQWAMMSKWAKVLMTAFLSLLAILGIVRWMEAKMIVVPPQP